MARTARSFHLFLIGAALLAVALAPVHADEVEDLIKEGQQAYQAGQLTEAIETFDYLLQVLRQQKGEGLEQLCPEPLAEWTTQDIASQAVGTAVLGGAVSVQCGYLQARDEAPDRTVKITMVTDAALLQPVMMLFSMPFGVGKRERIAGQKTLVEYDEDAQRGKITLVVDKAVLITVEGVQVAKETLKAYIKAIDFDALQAQVN